MGILSNTLCAKFQIYSNCAHLAPFKTTLYLKIIQTTFTITTFIYHILKTHAIYQKFNFNINPNHIQTTKFFLKNKHKETRIMIRMINVTYL